MPQTKPITLSHKNLKHRNNSPPIYTQEKMIFSRRELRKKAMQYLFSYFFKQKVYDTSLEYKLVKHDVLSDKTKDLHELNTSLVQEVDKIKTFFIQFIKLLIDCIYIDKQEKKIQNHSLLQDNSLLQRLQKHTIFTTIKPLNTWPVELTKTWYNHIIKHPIFITETKENSQEQDKNLVIAIVKKLILNNKIIQSQAALDDIFWTENKLAVKRLVLNFIEELVNEHGDYGKNYTIQVPKSEKDFYQHLIGQTVKNEGLYTRYIEENLKNWDPNRVMFLDQLLIKMALTELLHSSKTPKPIVINEYIEVAKSYSTDKSHLFINGMLESIINKVQEAN